MEGGSVMRRAGAALLFVVCMSTTALANPTIYKGTIGTHDVVVEFTEDIAKAKGPVAGRYFYPAQGVDIPLNPVSAGSGKAELAEEKPCNPEICKEQDGDAEPKPPVEAHWRLKAAQGGARVEGTWRREGGASLPIRLDRFGTRPRPEDFSATPEGLAGALFALPRDKPLDKSVMPYEWLKMQAKLQEGSETVWGNAAFRTVVDPRTKFGFPRVTRLGSPVNAGHPVNSHLQNRQWRLSLDALSCKSMQFLGLGWTSAYPGSEGANLGGYDEQNIQVEYLSPLVMSWSEAGSIYCGGAHPSHFANAYTLDVKRGEPLDLSRIVRGWVARPFGEDRIVDPAAARSDPGSYSWGPDDELKAFLLKQAEEKDPDLAKECEFKDMLREHLQISFKREDRAVFSLAGLPHAISGVCQGAFFEAPLAELREFLTTEAVEYFPSLKNR
jgi:hypothetical protein